MVFLTESLADAERAYAQETGGCDAAADFLGAARLHLATADGLDLDAGVDLERCGKVLFRGTAEGGLFPPEYGWPRMADLEFVPNGRSPGVGETFHPRWGDDAFGFLLFAAAVEEGPQAEGKAHANTAKVGGAASRPVLGTGSAKLDRTLKRAVLQSLKRGPRRIRRPRT
jgi:hypothetical protein